MGFTLREVPRTYKRLLERSELTPDEIDHVVLHQANKFMLDALQKKLVVPDAKFPRFYEDVGNTVSSTIPFVLADLDAKGSLRRGMKLVLIGFGVGLSWAGATAVW
jgi:3-oxoacyl-[acyl-carrier-protein] synthase-3